VSLDVFELGNDRIRRLTRAEYDRMIELGLFDEDERLELLDGILVAVSPQGAPHAYTIQTLNTLVQRALGDRSDVVVRPQLPLALGAHSEPEPDVAIVPAGNYAVAHPTTALLVIEVADESAAKDRRLKAPIYARAGIPEYWIIDLQRRVVDVFREPRDGAYQDVRSHGESDVLEPRSLSGLKVPVAAVLPPR
jgi:Uma2 family endonuclease